MQKSKQVTRSESRSRVGTTSEAGSPPRAQKYNQQIRQGLDDLDMPEELGYAAGPEVINDDFGWPDNTDGDSMFDDSEDPDSDSPPIGPDDECDDTPLKDRQLCTLEDIIGSRSATVAIRLEDGGDNGLRAEVVRDSEGAADALRELCRCVDATFNKEREKFDKLEWDQLLGRRDASPWRRLILLSRLDLDVDDSQDDTSGYSVSGDADEDDTDDWGLGGRNEAFGDSEEAAEKGPNEQARISKSHGLSRYGKFAVLPNGTPFNIRLLLQDRRRNRQRTRAGTQKHDFERLPEAIEFWAYRSVLDDEKSGRLRDENGKAWQDADAFRQIVKRLQENGLLSKAPHPGTWMKTLENIRTRFKQGRLHKWLGQHGLEHLALNRSDREKLFEATHVPSSTEGH